MDLRKQVEEALHQRRAVIQRQLQRMDGARSPPAKGKLLEGEEGRAEISRPVWRDLGGSGRQTTLACRCDQRGGKIEDFLIAKPTRKVQKTRKSKGKSSYPRMVRSKPIVDQLRRVYTRGS